MNTVKITAIEIEFEVFGQVHKAYAHTCDINKLEPAVLQINSTCHIEGYRTVVIDKDLFHEKNISNISKWVKKIGELSEEIQETI